MKRRLFFLTLTLFLLLTEVLIALFVRDRFIRPFFGDVLVAVLICALLRGLLPKGGPVWLPLPVFGFCATVEILQYFHYFSIPERLGLDKIPGVKIILGSSFDFADILCYAAGCGAFALGEWLFRKYRRKAL